MISASSKAVSAALLCVELPQPTIAAQVSNTTPAVVPRLSIPAAYLGWRSLNAAFELFDPRIPGLGLEPRFLDSKGQCLTA